jgi:hypothetical protein
MVEPAEQAVHQPQLEAPVVVVPVGTRVPAEMEGMQVPRCRAGNGLWEMAIQQPLFLVRLAAAELVLQH